MKFNTIKFLIKKKGGWGWRGSITTSMSFGKDVPVVMSVGGAPRTGAAFW